MEAFLILVFFLFLISLLGRLIGFLLSGGQATTPSSLSRKTRKDDLTYIDYLHTVNAAEGRPHALDPTPPDEKTMPDLDDDERPF